MIQLADTQFALSSHSRTLAGVRHGQLGNAFSGSLNGLVHALHVQQSALGCNGMLVAAKLVVPSLARQAGSGLESSIPYSLWLIRNYEAQCRHTGVWLAIGALRDITAQMRTTTNLIIVSCKAEI